MEKLLLRPSEAAAHLSIGRSKVYELMRLGQLRSVKIGGSRLSHRQPSPTSSRQSLRSRSDESPRPRRGFGVSRWRPLARRSVPWLRPRRAPDPQEGERCDENRSASQAAGFAVRTQRLPVPGDRLTVAGFLDRWLTGSL